MTNPALSLLIGLAITAVLTLLFWPDKGLWWRWQHARHLSVRVRSEDALKHIHKWEMNGRTPTLESIAGTLHISTNDAATLVDQMQADSLLRLDGSAIHLTPTGRESALHIIRAHRLLERYLAEETGYGEADWHGRAERLEHDLTPAELNALAMQLGNPTHDPHGDPIPTAAGDVVGHGGQPLTQLPLDTPATIVHIEDEPEVVYAQLVAEGLHPGMPVRVVAISPQRIRFWANGDEHMLAPVLANNVSVRPLPTPETAPDPIICDTLTCLQPGETAEVIGLSAACRGAERRRFMDLGILPGTKITAEMKSPSGDPTAYQIRGALIALRESQANLIKVKRSAG